ncbi:ABC transporter substrate-binding protein [Olsenella profusa]|uniref:ABC transporter substrate-binding protein n=1 Tax=Olsenella profusa TaxID=138595 RepID=A0ABS2F239_9ACTN|nr:ABC transporter substrate-binding protein [Olsenella profusa]MBM6774880.1 ABC transporter substrate-binding protein [Olsenella profusa]
MKKLTSSAVTRRTFLGGTAAASALALAACGGETTPADDGGEGGETTSGGGTIAAGSAYAPSDYNPTSTSSAFCLGANWHVLEGLYGTDPHDYSTFPELATGDPEQVDDTHFTVTLREGATFSNGNPVTAADVVESFDRTKANTTYAAFLTPIDSLEATDDATVTVTTAIANFSLLKERLALVRVFPAGTTDEELSDTPVGSGPWMYDDITDNTVDLVPNPNYNGSLPAEDAGLHYDILTDATARMTAQQQGTTHVMESVTADAIETIQSAGCKIDQVQGFGTRFIMFNTAKAPWDNVTARQAIMYAIDTDKMVTNIFNGLAAPASSYIPKDFPNYQEASVVYTYDAEKAQSLLDEAGVTPGDLVIRCTDNTQASAMATQVQQDLSALGFNASIEEDTSAATYAAIDGGTDNFDILIAPGDPSCWGADPDLLLNWWYGDNVWQQTRTGWGSSPEFAQLQELMTTALGQSGDEQQATWKQCYDIIAENCVLYPLIHVQTVTASWADATAPSLGTAIEGFSGIGTTGMYFLGCKTVSA